MSLKYYSRMRYSSRISVFFVKHHSFVFCGDNHITFTVRFLCFKYLRYTCLQILMHAVILHRNTFSFLTASSFTFEICWRRDRQLCCVWKGVKSSINGCLLNVKCIPSHLWICFPYFLKRYVYMAIKVSRWIDFLVHSQALKLDPFLFYYLLRATPEHF